MSADICILPVKEETMKIELEIPDELFHGRGSTFKKGIVDALLKSAKTKLSYTP